MPGRGSLQRAADARAKAGLDTQLDVMRATLLVSQAQASLGERQDALAAACERLDGILGRPVDAACVVAADDDEIDRLTSAGNVASEAATDALTILGRRADVLDSRSRVEDAKRALELSRWNLLPPLSLGVEYQQRGFGSTAADLFRPFNGWRLSLTSSYELDRASQAAAVSSAELAERTAERDAAVVEQRALADVRQSRRAVTRADQNASIQRQARRVAEQQASLAKLRYERGLADNFTVVDAENALFQAESAAIAADVERRLARLRLQRAAATLDPGRTGS